MRIRDAARRPPARVAIVTFVLLVAATSAWNLASPPGSGPDEAPHVVRAASLARGQLVGDTDPVEGGGSRIVQVPAVIDVLNFLPACWKGHSEIDAGCAPAFLGTTTIIDARTPAGAAPPLYYAIPAIALKIKASSAGAYLARELSILVCAALIASAVGLTRLVGSRPFLTAALFVSLTPTTLFISSVVNPSALEIASALLLWVAVLLLATEPLSSPHRTTLTWASAVAASTFVLSRQLSPLWLALVAITFLVLAGGRKAWAVVSTRPGAVASAVVAVTGLAALVWLKVEAPLKSQNGLARDISTSKALASAAGNVGYVYQTAVTGIGWLDFRIPQGPLLAYTIAAGTLLLVGIAAAGRRLRIAIAIMALATVVLPILIEASQYSRLGQTWQGRYSWPLAIGVLLMCGLALDRSGLGAHRSVRSLVRFVIGLVAFANLLTFYFALRRYEVGVRGGVWFLGDAGWDPPLPASAVLVLGLATVTAVFVLADRLVLRLFGSTAFPETEPVSAAE
ncbi:MAG TPA: DUF2142 domain-containing protein [Acidimicrobiales bacterium]|nr:DUF2142 domain-containing protein [Acidimicrobiales bacterium]